MIAAERRPLPRRKRLRHPSYDYSQPGAYFVTIVAVHRRHIFGEIVEDRMNVSDAGAAVAHAWDRLPSRFVRVELDAFVVMPNHVHGIVWLRDVDERDATPLGEVVRAFKSDSARGAHSVLKSSGSVWQRNYFEKVVRSQPQLDALRRYIEDNPQRWALDEENISA